MNKPFAIQFYWQQIESKKAKILFIQLFTVNPDDNGSTIGVKQTLSCHSTPIVRGGILNLLLISKKGKKENM